MWRFTSELKLLWRKWSLPLSPRWCGIAVIPILGVTGIYETRTSAVQGRFFSAFAKRLTYQVRRGASPRIVFPEGGPFNEARGYTKIPQFSRQLVDRRYHIAAQS